MIALVWVLVIYLCVACYLMYRQNKALARTTQCLKEERLRVSRIKAVVELSGDKTTWEMVEDM